MPDAAGAFPDLWRAATAAARAGDLPAALDACARARALCPDHPAAAELHGTLLYRAGQYAPARAAFADLVRLRPDDPRAADALGVALLALGHAQEARVALLRARDLAPDDPGILSNLGVALQQCGYTEEPLACYRAALARGAGAGVRLKLAAHLFELGRLDEARAAWQEARPALPMEADVGTATVLEREGRADEARALLRPWLDTPAPSVLAAARLATAWASLCREATPAEGLAPLDRLAATALPAPVRSRVQHARARLLDRTGDTAASFAALQDAHAHAAGRFDFEAHRRLVTGIVQAFPRARFEAPPFQGAPTARPLFIVGLPRSGTSLVEQILACHPAVVAGGEREAVGQVAARLAARAGVPWPAALDRTPAADLAAAAAALADEIDALAPTAARFTDKLPDNALHLGLIALLLPGARIVVCDRDPMDTLLSCHQQDFPPALAWSRTLDGLAFRALLHHLLMAHWTQVLPLPTHTVRYEALVTAPEREIPALLAFCGLDWDPACLHPERLDRVVATASWAQVRKPIGPGSIGRWRRYARELEPLRERLVRGGLVAP